MKKQYDIVGNRKKFFIFSAVLIVFILLFSVIFGRDKKFCLHFG